MQHEHVRARSRHFFDVLWLRAVGRCEEAEPVRHADEINLHIESRADGVELPDDLLAFHDRLSAHAGDVLHARTAALRKLGEQPFLVAERVLHEHAAENRRIPRDRDELIHHVQHGGVGVRGGEAPFQ